MIQKKNEPVKKRSKFVTIFVAMLAGCNVLIDLLTPLMIILLWTKIFNVTGNGSTLYLIIALLATLFRGIKYFIKD